MTITYYDKFAFLPKRCSKCNKLFIFEEYNIYYKMAAYDWDIKQIKCKICADKGKEKNNGNCTI